ncbi:MAG: isoprenylcysteine carboxylmethyltransferase family protein [Deltaproteobacteria bacterium]|nr:isoprenylcysteine carboxylmethyltransferase family protein [Deltaproteobacteria bacterium]
MPRFAIFAYVVFAALAFGWRSWVQYRRTGSTGFRGLSGRPGSLEWFGGVSFAVTCVVAAAAPVCDLLGIVPRFAALDGPAFRFTGVVLFTVGLVATLWAQMAMGISWRIGVDPTEETPLVTRGPFRLVRNPIFTAMGLAIAGLVFLVPNAVSILGLVPLVLGLELHVRLVEEPYLLGVHGEAYRRYASSTGRFLPGLGQMHAASK